MRAKNSISGITDSNGLWIENDRGVILDYFNSIFESTDVTGGGETIDVMEPRVTKDMQTHLDRRFSEEEVRTALFLDAPLKGLRP